MIPSKNMKENDGHIGVQIYTSVSIHMIGKYMISVQNSLRQTWKNMKSFRGQRFRVSQISANRESNISTF